MPRQSAIDHEILGRDLRRRVACERTLALADGIIYGSNPQEPDNLLFPGDDLLTPLERRRGMPKGNLPSQFFANVYLDGLARKTTVLPTNEPASFLGFVLLPSGRRRLPEGNVRIFLNRLRGLRDRWRQGTVTQDEVRRVRSRIVHAEHADTWRLRQWVFRAGWFDPAREPSPPPSASCAAAPGTTAPGNLRAANRNRNTPATDSAWPARSTAGIDGATAPPGAR